MLVNDFFTITAISIEMNAVKASLQLNEKHKIFDGHFPLHPVVPGVCLLQIVKEVVETALHKEIFLLKAVEIKFLKVINPNQNKVLQLMLSYLTNEDGTLHVEAKLAEANFICFKFKGQFLIRHVSQ